MNRTISTTILASLAVASVTSRAQASVDIESGWRRSGGPGKSHDNPRFELEVPTQQTLIIRLESETHNARLLLEDVHGQTIATDDNSGRFTDAILRVTLSPGRYRVIAASHERGLAGRFRFRVSNFSGTTRRCFFAYEHFRFQGASTLICSPHQPILNDRYSSLRIPMGMEVRAFEHAGFSGRHRDYLADARELDAEMNDQISSFTWIAFDDADFSMLVSADPQLSWAQCPNQARCNEEEAELGHLSIRQRASFYNRRVVDEMSRLGYAIGHDRFGGLVVNGDLTAFGDQHHFLDDYRELYDRRIDVDVWPGLGNHDYENNVNQCSNNGCTTGLIRHYFLDRVRRQNPIDFDYRFENDTHSGSLAYSWEIGDIHFVQLNNHPSYTAFWTNFNVGQGRNEGFDIYPSFGWLRRDLERAAGKKIVLNLHDWYADRLHPELLQILEDFDVVAIFAGHLHDRQGLEAWVGPFPDGRRVPVFLSGAPEWGTFLLTRYTREALYVWRLEIDQLGTGRLSTIDAQGNRQRVLDFTTHFDVCSGSGCARTYAYRIELPRARAPRPDELPSASRMRLWVDAGQPVGFGPNLPDGSTLSQPLDRSPAGRRIISSLGNRAVYREAGFDSERGPLPALELDGGDWYRTQERLDFGQGLTVFFAAHNRVRRNYNGIFSLRDDLSTHANFEVYWQKGNLSTHQGNLVTAIDRRTLSNFTFAHANDVGERAGDDVPDVFAVRYDRNSWRLQLLGADGQLLDQAIVGHDFAQDFAYIGYGFGAGGSFGLEGLLGEIVVYEGALSTTDTLEVLEYLREKWR